MNVDLKMGRSHVVFLLWAFTFGKEDDTPSYEALKAD
jgi:hypothetical protein